VTRSEEERVYRVPDNPRLGVALRSALTDFYFNSWRLVPANALWGLGLVVTAVVAFAAPGLAVLLTVLLAVPTIGIYRLAALIVRDRQVSFSDALSAWRSHLLPALVTGVALVGLTVGLGFNMLVGLASGEPILWTLATLAGWGLLATWLVALPFWPLLVDPVRDDMRLRQRARLAVTLVLVSPLRFGMLLALMLVVFVASAIFFAALVTISIAFIALVVTRYTLPAADRLEQRATQVLPG
jgi:uncharacterized membrane protein YesL